MAEEHGSPYCIVRFDNGRPMRSDIAFEYLDPDLPTLKVFREQEGLDRLADEATGEFDLILSVMDHVKAQWDQSWHGPMQHPNALEIIEDVRSGLRGNFCVYFTHVLLQALWSVGIPCRYVHVGVHHWQSHSTSECWSNDHRKWITVDSDFNLHYVRPELSEVELGPVQQYVVQNARDIQKAWRAGEMNAIVPRQGKSAMPIMTDHNLGNYYGGAFGFVADYEHALRDGLPEWDGCQCHWYIWDEPGNGLSDYCVHNFRLTHGNGVCTPISDVDTYYWPVNEVVVEAPDVARIERGGLDVRFETFTPFFSTFLVRHDGGDWHELAAEKVDGHRAAGRLRWDLSDGRNVLEIRSRNTSGRLGPAAMIEIASPPYVPPEPRDTWSVTGAGAEFGAFAVHQSVVHLPCQTDGHVAMIRNGEVERKAGTPVHILHIPAGPPVEPMSEPKNIARARTAAPGQLYSPIACAVAEDGTLYVADAENYRIQPFSPTGEPLEPWGGHGTGDDEFLHLRAIAIGGDGSLYVADSGYAGPVGLRTEHVSRVRRFETGGRLLGTVAEQGTAPGEVRSPAGLAVASFEAVWVADSGNHRVQVFSPSGEVLVCWGTLGDGWGELRYPTDVAPVDDETVFVADPQHHCVWKFTQDGKPLACLREGTTGKPLLRPGRLATDSGTLLVGDVGTGVIHRFGI